MRTTRAALLTGPLVQLTLTLSLSHVSLAAPAAGTNTQDEDGTVLRLLFALWRHGDRSPTSSYSASDPYKDSEYLPEGLGNLNAAGKKRAFDLGRYMRDRYGSFLGPELLPDLAVLRSTDFQRTIESGELVMAGMFPPTDDKMWNSSSALGQMWTPVAFPTVPLEQDYILLPSESACPAIYTDSMLGTYVARTKLSELVGTGDVREVLSGSALVDPDNLKQVGLLGDALIAQASCGLELPSWASAVHPEPLRSIVALWEGTFVYTKRQKKLSSGVFLNELLTESQAYQSGQLPARRKLYAYSAHDLTEISILSGLGVWDGKLPSYSTAIFIELRQQGDNGSFGFQVRYRNDTSEDPVDLTLPGCDFFCPLEKFQTLYEEVILTEEEQKTVCNAGD